MSRFVFKVAQPPPFLGSGFVLDPVTGLLDVASIAPQPLTGAILSGDSILISRNVGTAAVPNWTPYYASPSQVQALGSGSGAATTSSTTPTPTPITTPTPTPTPTSSTVPDDGTLSGLPSSIVAGQQLSAVYVASQASLYYALYNVASAAEEGLRWSPSMVTASRLTPLVPQNAGAYTVRGFAAATGGTKAYESAQFSVTAAPGALPAAPAQTADTSATATGVTMNWTSTATSYLVLASPGAGPTVSAPNIYGIAGSTTVTTNSYTFAHLSANSSPLAAVIPQNSSGFGPAAAFQSSVSTTAVANETLTLASPGAQAAGSTFTLSGTYSGITPTAFDLQRVGAVGWTAVAASSVTIGSGTFTIAGVSVVYTNPNTAYAVRDRNNPANTATSPTFAVS